MYRIFCESYTNYVNQYKDSINNNDYRYKMIVPIGLLKNIDQYKAEKVQETILYKQLSDLLFFMERNSGRFPKIKAFLWTLDSRDVKGQFFGIVPETDLEEQTKLVSMFLNLLYWEETEH